MKMKRFITGALAALFCFVCGAQNVAVFGDSYSTFKGWIPEGYDIWYSERPMGDNDVVKVEDTWWKQVVSRMGYTLQMNNSWSGSTVCNHGYRNQDYSDRSFLTRCPLVVPEGNAPDILLILAGTNDSWCGAPMGEVKYSDWTVEDSYSFLPAYCQMLDTLCRLAPGTRIVNIINDGLKPEVTLGIQEISLHYARTTGCDVEFLLLKDIDKRMNHPSVLGMKQIADQVCELLSKD